MTANYQGIPYPANAGQVDSFAPVDLELPGSRPRFANYTILGGQNLVKGSVLGQVTSTGKLKLCAAAAGDGSQNPVAVLHCDLNTVDVDGSTALDMTFDVAVSGGVYNSAALTVGAGYTAQTITPLLAARNMIVRTPGFSG